MELWQAMENRRDTRHFTTDPVPDSVLQQALQAAHLGPSVGLSEPGRYVIIRSFEQKHRIQKEFLVQRKRAEEGLDDEQRLKLHKKLKLEAIVDAPIGIAVFCDNAPQGSSYVLGTQPMAEALTWSVACSIQNLWLALTAQGYGMGWVSFLDPSVLSSIVSAPESWQAMGYLCVGRPATDYNGEPMLQKEGWRRRSDGPQIFHETVS